MSHIVKLRGGKQVLPLPLTQCPAGAEGILCLDMFNLVLLTQLSIHASLREHGGTLTSIFRKLIYARAKAPGLAGQILAVMVDPKWTQNGLDWPFRRQNHPSIRAAIFWARGSNQNLIVRVFSAILLGYFP